MHARKAYVNVSDDDDRDARQHVVDDDPFADPFAD